MYQKIAHLQTFIYGISLYCLLMMKLLSQLIMERRDWVHLSGCLLGINSHPKKDPKALLLLVSVKK